MATYTFKKNSVETLRWHPELMEGEGADEYFEYLWFDAVLEGGYYLRVAPFNSHTPHSHGIEKAGTPSYGFDLGLPNGKVIDHYQFYKPEEFKATDFGGTWGNNALFTGKVNDKGEVSEYKIKFDLANVSVDLVATCVAKTGVQFVDADHGYSYYHPLKKLAMGWWPLVPRAEVKGTITVDGKAVKVHGPAYLDKQLSNKKDTFGGTGQAWWTWGHFFCGPYTATFTDSAATAKYKYRHFAPFILWKDSDIVLATYDFTSIVEQYSIDKVTGKFYPSVLSQKAKDGSVEIYTQITNGVVTEVKETSLDWMKYVRQFADVNMEIYRYGGFTEEVKGNIIIEYGAGPHYMPWEKIDAK
jgi:hypothetical protein